MQQPTHYERNSAIKRVDPWPPRYFQARPLAQGTNAALTQREINVGRHEVKGLGKRFERLLFALDAGLFSRSFRSPVRFSPLPSRNPFPPLRQTSDSLRRDNKRGAAHSRGFRIPLEKPPTSAPRAAHHDDEGGRQRRLSCRQQRWPLLPPPPSVTGEKGERGIQFVPERTAPLLHSQLAARGAARIRRSIQPCSLVTKSFCSAGRGDTVAGGRNVATRGLDLSNGSEVFSG